MLNRKDNIDKISTKLAILAHKVELNSCLNLMDLNIHAEYFFCDLLNMIFNASLVNLNTINTNAKSIDLIDLRKRLAIQVTSTPEFSKIKKTVDGFIETENINNIDRLIVLIIIKKKRYQAKTYGDKFIISVSDDVLDYTDLIKLIMGLPPEKIQKICDYLSSQIFDTPSQKAPKEVTTILEMIKILSTDEHPQSGYGFQEEPDPNGKINKRFSAYAEYLMEIYVPLMAAYAGILNEINNSSDSGIININKLSAYLKRASNSALDECNGNPVDALNKLTDYYASRLRSNGVDYDDSAIQYYLIDNMIRCNVFPNKVKTLC
ncbi:SMEK domain-containing protein [Klebsiella variicola]|nr:SMEK domain-containing protein [Klebsiella variicola]QQM84782.1 SMEK domain-containing protein [Klebsiella variicola]